MENNRDDRKRTIRFCHLAQKSDLKVGDVVTKKQFIGIMGSTGQSTGAHVHLDIVEGWHDKVYRQSDITAGRPKADLNEIPYFIGDDWLFGVEAYVTTFAHDPRYIIGGKWKSHEGADIVPCDRKETHKHFALHWPRSCNAVVLRNDYDNGYGYHLHIGYRC